MRYCPNCYRARRPAGALPARRFCACDDAPQLTTPHAVARPARAAKPSACTPASCRPVDVPGQLPLFGDDDDAPPPQRHRFA